MLYAVENDPLCYPGSTVLRNKLGIEDQEELDEFELALFLTRTEEPLPNGNLNFDDFRAIHKHLFQDVYAWAGEIRTIRIGKGGNWFCYPDHIKNQMDRIFEELAGEDHLSGYSPEHFAARAAHYLAEINAIHAFREGNGRTQLTFLALLAHHAGFNFNADVLSRDRVMQAMIDSFAGDEAGLSVLIADIIAAP